jgi:nicotinamidase-related amidase
MLALDPKTSALILVDLQRGILGLPTQPRSTAEALATGKRLAQRFRAAGGKVVLVRVEFAEDFADALSQAVDAPSPFRVDGLSKGWSDFAEGLAEPGDLQIVKRQWGAFHGTELDLQLRRRGVNTVVIGGVATNFGVESTARQAWERGYSVVIAEDACASHTTDMHLFAVRSIFPRISRVTTAADIGFRAAADEPVVNR